MSAVASTWALGFLVFPCVSLFSHGFSGFPLYYCYHTNFVLQVEPTTSIKKALDCRQSALSSAQEARTLSEKITGLGYTEGLVKELVGVAERLTQSYHAITGLISTGKNQDEDYADLFEDVNANVEWLKSQKAVCNAMKKSADAQITAAVTEAPPKSD